jgi:hypothetical protein
VHVAAPPPASGACGAPASGACAGLPEVAPLAGAVPEVEPPADAVPEVEPIPEEEAPDAEPAPDEEPLAEDVLPEAPDRGPPPLPVGPLEQESIRPRTEARRRSCRMIVSLPGRARRCRWPSYQTGGLPAFARGLAGPRGGPSASAPRMARPSRRILRPHEGRASPSGAPQRPRRDWHDRAPGLRVRSPESRVRTRDSRMRAADLSVHAADLSVRAADLSVRTTDLNVRTPESSVRSRGSRVPARTRTFARREAQVAHAASVAYRGFSGFECSRFQNVSPAAHAASRGSRRMCA